MRSPCTLHEIKSSIGKLIALNKFISKATNKRYIFFQIVTKQEMEWRLEYEMTFQQLTEYLVKASRLSTPQQRDTLYIYLVVFE